MLNSTIAFLGRHLKVLFVVLLAVVSVVFVVLAYPRQTVMSYQLSFGSNNNNNSPGKRSNSAQRAMEAVENKYNLIEDQLTGISGVINQVLSTFQGNQLSEQCTLGSKLLDNIKHYILILIPSISLILFEIEEYINQRRLQQDHPCVIEIIRKQYLNKPPVMLGKVEEPKTITDPSSGQSQIVLRLLKNQVIII